MSEALPKTWVLASRNRGKLRELEALLAPLGVQLRLVSEFTDEAAEETAPSFVENALLKARHACRVSGLPAIAEDSGLEVDALKGAPGVYSARYAGEPSDDAANNAKLLEALRGVPAAQRGARYLSLVVALRHAEDPVPLIAQGEWRGRILEAPRGNGGFGYDPLFAPLDAEGSVGELSAEHKNRLSHRGKALQALLVALRTC